MNCLTCQAIHDNLDCKQYQEQVRQALESNVDVKRTREMLEVRVWGSIRHDLLRLEIYMKIKLILGIVMGCVNFFAKY